MIKRHKIIQRWLSPDSIEKELEKRIKRLNNYLDFIKENTGKSNQFINGQISNLICILLLLEDHRKDLLYTGLIYYLDTGISHFEQFFTQGELISSQIGNGKFQFETIESDLAITCNQWVNLLSAALILKDKKRLNSILKFQSSLAELEEDTFKKPFIQYMGCIASGKLEEQLRKTYVEAMEKSSESNEGIHILLSGKKKGIVPNRSKYLKTILLPIVKLCELAILKEEDAFNEHLAIFLKQRAEYFNKKQGVIEDFIDIKASACCAYASERGINISVEGEYIPRRLWEGDWEELKVVL